MSDKYKSGPTPNVTLDDGAGLARGQTRYGNSFDESKVKRAPDGKFGVIGKTKSGKSVHEHAGHESHREFSAEDHQEASSMHAGIAHTIGDKNRPLRDYHTDQANLHDQAFSYGTSFDEIQKAAADYKKPGASEESAAPKAARGSERLLEGT